MTPRPKQIRAGFFLLLLTAAFASGCGGGGGSGSGNNVVPPVNPSRPTGLSVSLPADRAEGATLTWNEVTTFEDGAPFTNKKGYNIYRKTTDSYFGDADYAKIGFSASASYVDDDVFDGDYTYKVRALSTSGFESLDSSAVSVTTAPAILLAEEAARSAVDSPFDVTVAVNETFDALLFVEDVTNLFTIGFELNFQSQFLEVVSISYDADDRDADVDNFLAPVDDLLAQVDQNGSGAYAALAGRNDASDTSASGQGQTGSGFVARITLRAKAVTGGGYAELSLNDNVNVSDPASGDLILLQDKTGTGSADPIAEFGDLELQPLRVRIQ